MGSGLRSGALLIWRRDALVPHPPHRHSTSSGSDGLAMAFVVGFLTGFVIYTAAVVAFAYCCIKEWARD